MGSDVDTTLRMDFELTEAQKKVSGEITENLKRGTSVFLSAVTGAGKSEITFEGIRYFLGNGKKVGFAVPRRQVVLQLASRFAKAFPNLTVTKVCEGYTSLTEGDLIVCTTHQLYRYHEYFDYLVVDEADAFPFLHNPMLEKMTWDSCKGVKLIMSATLDEGMVKRYPEYAVCTLSRRPSNVPLAMPVCKYRIGFVLDLELVKWILRKNENQVKCMVFFPSIDVMEIWYRRMRKKISCGYLSSKSTDKEDVIAKFDSGKIRFLFTTTLMERGVTFSVIELCVYHADHEVFTMESLVQIMGRVGRDVSCPYGEGVFLCRRHTAAIEGCIRNITRNNHDAYGV